MNSSDEERHPKPTPDYGSTDVILAAVHRVRDTLIEVFAAAGVNPTEARATARALSINRTYINPVVKFIRAKDVLTVVNEIPSAKRIEVLLKSCLVHGAAPADAQKVRDAVVNYETIVAKSAGDRDSFVQMVMGLSFEDVTERQFKARQMAFQANSTLWGARAKLDFKVIIFYPSRDEPGGVGCCKLGGLLDLRRLRPMQWPLHRTFLYQDDGQKNVDGFEPLDPDFDQIDDLPLVRSFCSSPLPKIERVTTSHGLSLTAAAGPIGNAGSIDVVIGELFRFGKLHRTEKNKYLAAMLDLQTPSEAVMFDWFVHRDLGLNSPPEVMLLDRLNFPRGYVGSVDEWSKMPLSVGPTSIGAGLTGCTTPLFPKYRSLLEYAFDHIHLDAAQFVGHRLSFDYPTIPSALLMRNLKPPG